MLGFGNGNVLGSVLRVVREGVAEKSSGVAMLLLNTDLLSNSNVQLTGKCLSGEEAVGVSSC